MRSEKQNVMRKPSIVPCKCVHSGFTTRRPQLPVILNKCLNCDQMLPIVLQNRDFLESDPKTCTQAGFLEETLKKSVHKI